VPVAHLNVSWSAIILIVSHTVSDSEAFKVWLKDICIIGVSSVVVINVVREVRDVNAGI
jgi:hypothetical protein